TAFNVADGFALSDLVVSAALSGLGTLRKQGTGTMVLTGTSTSFLGTTRVEVGRLLVNGNITNSPVVLAGGTLGGSGTTGNVNNVAGVASTLSPGDTGAGRLSTGALTLGSDVTYVAQLNGITPGTTYDTIDARGIVTLNNAALNATVGFTSA